MSHRDPSTDYDEVARLMMPHEPDDECAPVHCYSHNRDEPGPGYRACYECGHLYRRAGDLRRAARAIYRDAARWPGHDLLDRAAMWWRWLTVRASRVHTCPECAHDF